LQQVVHSTEAVGLLLDQWEMGAICQRQPEFFLQDSVELAFDWQSFADRQQFELQQFLSAKCQLYCIGFGVLKGGHHLISTQVRVGQARIAAGHIFRNNSALDQGGWGRVSAKEGPLLAIRNMRFDVLSFALERIIRPADLKSGGLSGRADSLLESMS
jgi:hypothetical protein